MRPHIRPLMTLLLALLALAGCVSAPPPGHSAPTSHDSPRRWHTSCFRFHRDAQQRPVWALDLLLADRMLAPALEIYRADIPLWRVHRRAADDDAGHQFSVLLYTSDATYGEITQFFDRSPALRALQDNGRLRQVMHGCRAAQSTAAIEATSDPAWDPAIQRTWPWFIMGVSASWLALIRDLETQSPLVETSLIDGYAGIDRRIGELWAGQGQHAYLHHLSGIYGYRPLRIQTWMQY
jgi:hypothetical protein